MAFNGSFLLTFGGIPFCTDRGEIFEISFTKEEIGSEFLIHFGKESRPEADLMDEVNRLIPFEYLNDFAPPSAYPGRNLGAIAHPNQGYLHPNAQIKVGEWYYPTNASRWSVCRFLATSTMVQAMLAQTAGSIALPFVMKSFPDAPTGRTEAAYTITTDMFMLPPRPLSELGGSFDGLFLVTLVDDRWYLKNTPMSLRVTRGTTWVDLLTELSEELNITLNFTAISAAYGQPEPDSQLWTNEENAAALLDAVAWNIGRVVVREYDGTYSLLTYAESISRVATNRPSSTTLVRVAGGDLFDNTGFFPAGSLRLSKNSVIPGNITVTFPKYVQGDDPVPHFLNSRYAPQRPSAWYEESYGETHNITVPIASGPVSVSGLTGVSESFIHTTAKALLETEAAAPTNLSGIRAMAIQLAQDYWNAQAGAALDEVYPGTLAWLPEGYHDILWTYSDKKRLATTRVLRAEWNQTIVEMQHSAPALSGETNVPRGVGGPSVAQTWLDEAGLQDFSVNPTLSGPLLSGAFAATLNTVDNLPTQYRWKGQVNDEVILFNGTSGGTTVGIVYRGIDGTIQTTHSAGGTVSLLRNTVYGANLVTTEKMQFAYPGRWTSGGIQEVIRVPQTQTVFLFSASGVSVGGISYYSGQVESYDPTAPQFIGQELIWIQERNEAGVTSGNRYDGQFAGFSKSGPVSPIYLINTTGSGTGGGGGDITIRYISGQDPIAGVTTLEFQSGVFTLSGTSPSVAQVRLQSGGITSGFIGDDAVVSGSVASGHLFTYHHASGATITRAQFTGPFASGTFWTAITEELISGVRAVHLSPSGLIRIAMASVAAGDRMPAIGIVVENVAGGLQANVYTAGVFQFTSGMNNYSGYLGKELWVGQSGHVVQADASWMSGGFVSGDTLQYLGVAWNSGGAQIEVQAPHISGAGGGGGGNGITVGLISGQLPNTETTTLEFQSGVFTVSGTSPNVAQVRLQSGGVTSGYIGDAAVVSGSIASGQLDTYHFASGATAPRSEYSTPFVSGFLSGTAWTVMTQERISGVRAVALSESGNLLIAMASWARVDALSGNRWPAIGVVVENVESGIQANVYAAGALQFASGRANYSGFLGQELVVGRSGHVAPISGSWNSGGLLSGDGYQFLGVARTSGGVLLNIGPPFISGLAAGLTVREFDTVPTLNSITTLEFVQSGGFVVTSGAAGVARINISGTSFNNIGVVHLQDQVMGRGIKTFQQVRLAASGGTGPIMLQGSGVKLGSGGIAEGYDLELNNTHTISWLSDSSLTNRAANIFATTFEGSENLRLDVNTSGGSVAVAMTLRPDLDRPGPHLVAAGLGIGDPAYSVQANGIQQKGVSGAFFSSSGELVTVRGGIIVDIT